MGDIGSRDLTTSQTAPSGRSGDSEEPGDLGQVTLTTLSARHTATRSEKTLRSQVKAETKSCYPEGYLTFLTERSVWADGLHREHREL